MATLSKSIEGVLGVLLVATMALAGVRAQTGSAGTPLWMRTSAGAVETSGAAEAAAAGAEVLRTIDDPHTGARWLLLRNAVHPEGPGVLVLVAAGGEAPALRPAPRPAALARSLPLPPQRPPAPLVKSGETILVHESTPVVEALLEAVAVGSAPAGQEMLARLRIGGRLVRVRVTGPGRTEFVADAERVP